MFDPSEYFSAMIRGVPLLFVIYGLVRLYGELGATGRVQLLSSFGTGVVIGTLVMLAQVEPPTNGWWIQFGYWFGNIFYGLGLGIAASLYYESQKNAQVKAIKVIEEQAVLGGSIRDD